MKLGNWLLLAGACFTACAITSSSDAQTNYTVVARGLNYNVLQKTAVVNGTNQIQSYTELATGLNFTNASGQLAASSEQISILPTGGAAATNGQHKVYFPGDIGSGVLEVITPDGRQLRSRPLAVSYDDGSNTVFIATLTNAIGYLTASNQVTYRNCFNGIKADIVATYRRGGFECDLVLREQPQDPGTYGLDPDYTTLQLITEFFNTQDPEQVPSAYDDWFGLQDSTLKFGKLTMTRGKAFGFKSSGTKTPNTSQTPVYKSWVHAQSRTFLVEQVPLVYVADDLNALPLTARNKKPAANNVMLASRREFPPAHGVLADTNRILLAAADFKKEPGVVLDYVTIDANGDYPGYDNYNEIMTFQADTTYYVSAPYYYEGLIIQGGAVIKFDPSVGWNNEVNAAIDCQTSSSHPAFFTSMNDDSVGETILGSTGSPAVGDYSGPCFFCDGFTQNLHDLQLAYCGTGFYLFGNEYELSRLENIEFCHVGMALDCEFFNYEADNILMADVAMAFGGYNSQISVANLTLDQCGQLWDHEYFSDGTLAITNSLLIGVADFGDESTSANNATSDSDVGIFQTAGNASHYLAANSPYRNAGTTAIGPDLLAELQTMTTYAPQDGGYPDNDGQPDLGYHYPVNEDSDHNGMADAWEWKYFGQFGVDPNADYDADGVSNLQEYQNGTDPNKIQFIISAPGPYVAASQLSLNFNILGGVPSQLAILVDNPNESSAAWNSYNSSATVSLGAAQGLHTVYVGMRGLPADAQQTWQQMNFYLDTVSPIISITSPANNVSLNTTRVNVNGSFTETSLKQITVNGVPAFINGNTYEALNVPLATGANTVTATATDLSGNTATATINITGASTLVDPVQLSATPVAGFSPLAVSITIAANVPGTIQQITYDFNGDNIPDQTAADLSPITHTYSSAGQYFPAVTIQTTQDRFSSDGGWNADASRVKINVQQPPVSQNVISVTDPVDLKCDAAGNLYVLSQSTATITEYNSSGTSIRSISSIGTSPSGLDVDSSGNVYVAFTGDNQIARFNPTTTSFQLDPTFGNAGVIGRADKSSGSGNGEFNAPFDVAVSPDGSQIAVSDSGNNRIEMFLATDGSFASTFGQSGSGSGQFSAPKGLTYDSIGYLYIVDSGNNRIAVTLSSSVIGTSGTLGTGLGQFQGAINLGVGSRGIYVADTGNNRMEIFDPLATGELSTPTPFTVRGSVSTEMSLNQPNAIAAVANSLTEMVCIADTGNNRVILCKIPDDNLNAIQAAWNNMKAHVASGDVNGALVYFSVATVDEYREGFYGIGIPNITSAIGQIGALTPDYLDNDSAEFYFTRLIGGQTITFPVKFTNENGVWKIKEF